MDVLDNMRTRLPIQAKSTGYSLASVLPGSFSMVKDPTSNGYKYFNMLFGVELDEAKLYMREIFNNSFLTTMDFGSTGDVYQVTLQGITSNQVLNSTTDGIPIKIVNNGSPGGEVEFWEGDPTRCIYLNTYSLGKNLVDAITGLQYMRVNNSGYGYFLVGTDVDQANYDPASGSAWHFDVNSTGAILSNSGYWPGIQTQSYDIQGIDEILTPLGSGYLSQNYPLQIQVLDDLGYYHMIDAYDPYHGWVRDAYDDVIAVVDYSGNCYYGTDGTKIYYRVAFNNPNGSGNYTEEYLTIGNIPISGTLHLYDIDALDDAGNATEIPSTGINLYWLQGTEMLTSYSGMYTSHSGIFDPVYMGYSSTVPNTKEFGSIAGSAANLLTNTSWSYQYGSGYIDEGTKQWVEGSGAITNLIKITNPRSRYVAEYKFKTLNKTKYVTSLEQSRYIALATTVPAFSIETIFNNQEIIPYKFTEDPRWKGISPDQSSRYMTFDGYNIRPNSQISRVDFDLPIKIQSGGAALGSYQQRDRYIGYSSEFVPIYSPQQFRTYVLDCPFSGLVVGGACTESDLSGSGNVLEWVNTGSNMLYRSVVNGTVGKTTQHISGSGYFNVNNMTLLNNNFFRWDFRLFTPNDITLMDMHDTANNAYLTVMIRGYDGRLIVTSNGSVLQSRYIYKFDGNPKGLIIQTWFDINSGNPAVNIYTKDGDRFVKSTAFITTNTLTTISDTYLHVLQNCTADINRFRMWYEGAIWPV